MVSSYPNKLSKLHDFSCMNDSVIDRRPFMPVIIAKFLDMLALDMILKASMITVYNGKKKASDKDARSAVPPFLSVK